MELTVDEEFGTQEAPVDGPLEQELTPDVKRTHHVADRVDQQERQAEKQLKQAGVNGNKSSIHGKACTCAKNQLMYQCDRHTNIYKHPDIGYLL